MKTLNIFVKVISLPFVVLGFIGGFIVNALMNGFYYSGLFFKWLGWEE